MLNYLKFYALFNLGNGLVMLIAPEHWYAITPGASDSGPFNTHFVRDIGIAFMAAGAGLAYGALLKKAGSAVVAMIFIGGHGLLHLVEMISMDATAIAIFRDFSLIVVPASIAVYGVYKLVLLADKPQHADS